MKKNYTLVFLLLISQFVTSQIVINELDCDTPSIDDKEFIELKSETPNFTLDGYVVVFFNSSTSVSTGLNKSYLALDLDGYTTDVNGLLLIGSTMVSPFPQYIISPNLIQNGPDAVAIYQADDLDFEDGTLAYVDETLIDVLLYDTTDANDADLIALFSAFNPDIQQINEGPAQNSNSIQRFVDAFDVVTYVSTVPTPRQLNDGSGIVLNGILMDLTQTMFNEGDVFDIGFTSEQNVTEDLVFSLNLENYGFNTSDFTGNTSITILNGQKTASTTLTLVDDAFDEGDEEMVIKLSGLTSAYVALNNNLKIRVVDNDWVVASFGTPVNPSFGNVASTVASGYYDSLDGLADGGLDQELQNIISEEGVVRAQTYSDIVNILKEADQNPANSNQVWLLYTEQGRAKLDYQTTSYSTGKWNREHTYPRSRGGFNSIELDEVYDGKDIFWNTTADSLRHGNSDAHALRAADGPENSSRNNQNYGIAEYDGPTGNAGSFYGDVARSVFYMTVRYNGLSLVDGYPGIDPIGQLGDLATLLDWHRNDPPDDFEMNRNNVVYSWQFNRNPFIDHPDLVEHLWGDKKGVAWSEVLGVDDVFASKFQIYPNPSSNRIYIVGMEGETTMEVFSSIGTELMTRKTREDTFFDMNLSKGIYFIKITSEGKSIVKKVIIK